jgi:rsbT co-antagonist protein RsbR
MVYDVQSNEAYSAPGSGTRAKFWWKMTFGQYVVASPARRGYHTRGKVTRPGKMAMDDGARRLLREVLSLRRAEIIEEATDWVRGQAIDLGTKRPREETRALSVITLAAYEAALLSGDMAPFQAYLDHLTKLRVAREFRVSTLLRGLGSIRWAIARFLRSDIADGWTAFEILTTVDSLYHDIAFQLADIYTLKLNETVDQRRLELEADLQNITEAKARELEDKMALIEAQRRMLAALSLPVIRIWEGILVVPLVGDITEERAADLLEKALGAIREDAAGALILDITGLSRMDAEVARRLLALLQAAKLLGAEGILVGVSSTMARTLIELGVDLSRIRTVGTLEGGLRAALRGREPRPFVGS